VEEANIKSKDLKDHKILEVDNFNKEYLENQRKEVIQNLSFTQCATCEAPNISTLLSTIDDMALIMHSPTGCAASFNEFNRNYRIGLEKRGLPIKNANLICTNLIEKDVIFGVDDKLEEAVQEAIIRFNPRAIFITASCGSGVTGMDIQDVIDRIQSKFKVRLVTIVCELYHNKKWGSGFDGDKNSFLKKIIKSYESKESDLYNLINFSGDDTIIKLIKNMDIKFNYVASYTSYSNLEKMGEAKATISISKDNFSNYLGSKLEKEYGVKNIELPMPCGFNNTDILLREVGKLFHKEKEIENIIINEKDKYKFQLERLKKRLSWVSCLPIILKGRNHYEKAVLDMLRELGMKIIGDSSNGEPIQYKTIVPKNNKRLKMFQMKDSAESLYGKDGLKIAMKQNYQLVNFINNQKPDVLLVMHYSLGYIGNRMGIPTICLDNISEIYAYAGLVKFGNEILKAVSRKGLLEKIAQYNKLPYSNWWMEQELIWTVSVNE
jgi:nitrogenase molybdenum-iron protein alpha chain